MSKRGTKRKTKGGSPPTAAELEQINQAKIDSLTYEDACRELSSRTFTIAKLTPEWWAKHQETLKAKAVSRVNLLIKIATELGVL
jgi:hypothetical protein